MDEPKPKLEPWQILIAAGLAGVAVLSQRKRQAGLFADSLDQLKEAIRSTPRRMAEAAAEEIAAAKADYEERKRTIGKGAHDPGAIIINPDPDEAITVQRYGPGTAIDALTGRRLTGAVWGGLYDYAGRAWTLTENRGNWPVVAHLRGEWSPGWRPGCLDAKAITIHHAHPDSYFPYRDAVYADTLPLDRVAAMIQAVHEFPHEEKRRPVCLVVIDNREAHRAEHARLAALESPDVIRGKNGTKTPADEEGAVIWLGQPDPLIVHDEASKVTRDPRTGLSLATRPAGDRDYSYELGTVSRGVTPIATLSLHERECWRPGYCETRMINLNRAHQPRNGPGLPEPLLEADLPFNLVAPLLNVHPPFFWRGEHRGRAVVVDTRARPIEYYYG
jgi:hypothetical protein